MTTATLILGCHYEGQMLAQHLAFQGEVVVGTASQEPDLSIIRTRGAEALKFDGRLSSLKRISKRVHRIVVGLSPELGYDEALVSKLSDWGLPKGQILYLSKDDVYGQKPEGILKEDSPTNPDTALSLARCRAEELWQGIGAKVMRVAELYGPSHSLLQSLAGQSELRIAGETRLLNPIHVFDLVSLILKSFDSDRSLFLATSGECLEESEILAFIEESFGLPMPKSMPLLEARLRLSKDELLSLSPKRRLDGQLTLQTLSHSLRYPHLKKGLEDIWQQEKVLIETLRDRKAKKQRA